jgi:hypothetical protein
MEHFLKESSSNLGGPRYTKSVPVAAAHPSGEDHGRPLQYGCSFSLGEYGQGDPCLARGPRRRILLAPVLACSVAGVRLVCMKAGGGLGYVSRKTAPPSEQDMACGARGSAKPPQSLRWLGLRLECRNRLTREALKRGLVGLRTELRPTRARGSEPARPG